MSSPNYNNFQNLALPRPSRQEPASPFAIPGNHEKAWQRQNPGKLRKGWEIIARDPYRFAFGGVWLFTLLLYLRPHDWFPSLAAIPLAKTVAIITPLAYVIAKLGAGDRMVWTLETKMIGLMGLLGILFIPIAASPRDAYDTLMDPFLKVVIIFILMINLIKTRERLRSIWKLVTVCGTILSLSAIKRYASGELTLRGDVVKGVVGGRIEGAVGGMFGNPNDLATALDMLLPLAVALALSSKGIPRLFYIACSAIMAMAVLITFSRAGFLGMVAAGGLMLWKLSRGHRVKMTVKIALIAGILLFTTPGGYGSRLTTIFNIDEDATGSAQQRRQLLDQAIHQAIRHPIIGIGMGNFYIYSFNAHVAHNSYLETAAELGWIGFLAYMIFLVTPMRGLRNLEHRKAKAPDEREREMACLSVGVQATIAAYAICSFFASIQYLWYIYYAVGYAIALRVIHSIEEGSAAGEPDKAGGPLLKQSNARGKLWQNGRSANRFSQATKPHEEQIAPSSPERTISNYATPKR